MDLSEHLFPDYFGKMWNIYIITYKYFNHIYKCLSITEFSLHLNLLFSASFILSACMLMHHM